MHVGYIAVSMQVTSLSFFYPKDFSLFSFLFFCFFNFEYSYFYFFSSYMIQLILLSLSSIMFILPLALYSHVIHNLKLSFMKMSINLKFYSLHVFSF